MYLVLMRHGDAGAYTSPDSARRLTDLGENQAKSCAKQWDLPCPIDTIMVSPYARAKDTLSVVMANKNLAQSPTICEHITPISDIKSAIKSINDNLGQCTLVVCHMPIIAKICAHFSGDDTAFSLCETRVIDVINQKVVARFLPKEL